MDRADYGPVLVFWFEECSPRQWFAKNPELDDTIRRRFLPTYRRAAAGETQRWRQQPEGRLAEIIVLDQFPRNMFRDSPQAFATDTLALGLAQEAVRLGVDKKLSANQRHCLYLPYMHSESRTAHADAVRLFFSLPPWKWVALLYELRHKRIIDRFGRYPHRNAALGRISTPEEQAFLATHAGF
jgi:uncharacterized protein (DUF924 family)